MHLPKVGQKVRPPRMMHIRFPLGKTFGIPGDVKLQRRILMDLLTFAIEGEAESLVELPYRWKRPLPPNKTEEE